MIEVGVFLELELLDLASCGGGLVERNLINKPTFKINYQIKSNTIQII
jgi:hypothetical protein